MVFDRALHSRATIRDSDASPVRLHYGLHLTGLACSASDTDANSLAQMHFLCHPYLIQASWLSLYWIHSEDSGRNCYNSCHSCWTSSAGAEGRGVERQHCTVDACMVFSFLDCSLLMAKPYAQVDV